MSSDGRHTPPAAARLEARSPDEDRAPSGGARDEERLARATLSRMTEPGRVGLYRWVTERGAVQGLRQLREGGPDLPVSVERAASARRHQDLAERDLALLRRCGGRFLIPADPEWPGSLDDPGLPPPFGLWVRGDVSLGELALRSVSIVGSRAATSYGQYVAAELGHGLGERGWTVVSGGAYGIDGAAHSGALAAGGTTIAVLAGGVDRPYPSGHAALFSRIAASGLLLSEWPPGSAPQRPRFLVRNRVIAALSAGTVVVEAAARSGALSTARWARELNRPLMAVPGPVTGALSVGCHELLRLPGCTLVTGTAHVLDLLGDLGSDAAPPARGPERARDRLRPEQREVLEAVPLHQPATPDRIAMTAAVPVAEVLRTLPGLVLSGHVEQTAAGYRQAPVTARTGAGRVTAGRVTAGRITATPVTAGRVTGRDAPVAGVLDPLGSPRPP